MMHATRFWIPEVPQQFSTPNIQRPTGFLWPDWKNFETKTKIKTLKKINDFFYELLTKNNLLKLFLRRAN